MKKEAIRNDVKCELNLVATQPVGQERGGGACRRSRKSRIGKRPMGLVGKRASSTIEGTADRHPRHRDNQGEGLSGRSF